MPDHGDERCIDGSKYRFISDVMGSGDWFDDDLLEGYGLTPFQRAVVKMLRPIAEHYTWRGTITPMEVRIPADVQRHQIHIHPAARTIRIETSGPVEVWLNNDSGVSITMGGDRRVLYLSDLPPAAAIRAIYVTTVETTYLNILAVA